MSIEVESSTKRLLARCGPNKLFGEDVDDRKVLGDVEAEQRFDHVWATVLEREVKMADRCNPDDVYQRLTERQRNYFEREHEHRSFRPSGLNAEFIVQLERRDAGDDFILNQLWRMQSSDSHPKTLFVNFPSVDERKRFAKLAKHLGITDCDLGLALLQDFMAKHPRRFFEE